MNKDGIETEPVVTEPEEAEESLQSLELVYSEVKERLGVQLQQVDASDAKTGTILFIGSIVIGIGAAAQAAFVGQEREDWVLLLFVIPLLSYLLMVFFALRSWVVRPYFRDPEPKPLRDYYLSRSPEFTKRRLLTHFIHSYEWNAKVMKKKVRELRIANWFLLAEVVALVTALSLRPWLA
jgi:hypothetical protein